MCWFLTFCGLIAMNVVCWVYFPGSAMIGVDPVVAAAAIFGLASAEWWMLRGVVTLERATKRLNEKRKLFEEPNSSAANGQAREK